MKRKGGLKVSARTARAAKTFEVEVDKPLGLALGQKPNGGVVITVSSVETSIAPFKHFCFSLSFYRHQTEFKISGEKIMQLDNFEKKPYI